ncbi:hypothetical protein CMO88_00360 [Candidatus Woesearchaeota archaeon]|nr:hypothetical protein [Candidatus Woesearchaeota archaeon]|tara:strand:+ start:52849 stop:53454 length:606 start_codon:yes stop_codon:yes gene_type:complete
MTHNFVIGYETAEGLAEVMEKLGTALEDRVTPIKINSTDRAARVLLLNELYGEVGNLLELALQNAPSDQVVQAVREGLEKLIFTDRPKIGYDNSATAIIKHLTEQPYQTAVQVSAWSIDQPDVNSSFKYRNHASSLLKKLLIEGVLGAKRERNTLLYVELEIGVRDALESTRDIEEIAQTLNTKPSIIMATKTYKQTQESQ